MGAAGAVQFGIAKEGDGMAARHVFPSYRFPESAALALSRAAQYATFRSRPAGRLPWYDDIDASAARQAVSPLARGSTGGVVWVEGERAERFFRVVRTRSRGRRRQSGDSRLRPVLSRFFPIEVSGR